MASDTDSARNDESDLALTWSGRWTLSHRILAVNILTLVLIALVDPLPRRLSQPAREGAAAPGRARKRALRPSRSIAVPSGQREPLLAASARSTDSRLRLYAPRRRAGARQLARHRPDLSRCAIPTTQRWSKDAARALDRGFNALVGERRPRRFRRTREPTVPTPGAKCARRDDRATCHRCPPRARPDPGFFRRRAARRRLDPARHRQRPRFHPHRAQPARRARAGARHGRDPARPAVAVPRANHRPAAAPDRDRRAPGSPWPGARGAACPACPRAATRSACWPARSAT